MLPQGTTKHQKERAGVRTRRETQRGSPSPGRPNSGPENAGLNSAGDVAMMNTW